MKDIKKQKDIKKKPENNSSEKIEEKNNIEISVKEIEDLKASMQRLLSEVQFGTNASSGNITRVQELMDKSTSSILNGTGKLNNLITQQKESANQLKENIGIITLLPQKTQESLKRLVPEIVEEIEKVHSSRIQEIKSILEKQTNSWEKLSTETLSRINLEAKNQLSLLKEAIEDSKNIFNENALKKEENLKLVAKENLGQIKQLQSKQMEIQEEMFKKFVSHTTKEIEAVTSNHGSKFLRNTAICLILSAVTGGITGWYVNQYFPSFVSVSKAGNVVIRSSHVKVWEANQVKEESE